VSLQGTTAGEDVTGLPEIPGRWAVREIKIGPHTLQITLPALPDAFLDDPQVQAAHDRDDFMPYWPYLWPAALSMAERVAAAGWPRGTPVLEIGSGVGLVGLTALAGGLQVTFSDYAQPAVDVALHNARLNGFEHAEGVRLDWRQPLECRWPVILGCDVIYERSSHRPILELLRQMLTPGGEAWLGDAGRQHAPAFQSLARELSFDVELQDETGRPLPEPRHGQFQLFVLRAPLE
jgi:ETFB lysine methyltransferase